MVESPRIWLSSPHMGGKELDYIKEAFDTNWIAPLGPHVNNFEADIAKYTTIPHVAALTSGTAAIHLALILLGVKRDDEVICQSFTFSASANPVVYQGAKPVFIDSEKDTWNMSPEHLVRAIQDGIKRGKKPKAVILVHLYGMPAKVDEIKEYCSLYEIPLIEDAAESLGSKYKDIHTGRFGDFATFSFNGNKIITTSGGGALASFNEPAIKKARFYATQSRDDAPHYEHSEIGYNYRLSNVLAGIGRGQMEVLDDRIKKRRDIFDFYTTYFNDIDGLNWQKENEDNFSNRWLSCLTVDPKKTGGVTRENIREGLWEDNIESRPLWKPMHLQPVFKDAPYFGEGVCDELFEKGLCMPSGSNLEENDLVRIKNQLERVMNI